MYLEDQITQMQAQINEMHQILREMREASRPRVRVGTDEAVRITGLHRNTLLKYRREGILSGEINNRKNYYFKDELERLRKNNDHTAEKGTEYDQPA